MDIKQRILRITDNGMDIFQFYLNAPVQLKKKFRNPLYADTKAGCNIFRSADGTYVMHDFGDSDQGGDCFDFVAKLHGLDCSTQFVDVLRIIISDMGLPIYEISGTGSSIKTSRAKNTHPKAAASEPKEAVKKYSATPMEWNSGMLAYWEKYGIGLDILTKYNVKPLTLFSSIGEKGPYDIAGTVASPMFAYCGDGYMKIYRPYSDFRFMYAGKSPSPYIFGFKHLPTHGDVVFITGGEKDVMSLAAHGFNAICFNSETASIPESTIEMLRMRFRHIIFMYDCDETGVKSMTKAVDEFSKYGVLQLTLPLAGTKTDKDISDYFAKGNTAERFHKLLSSTLEETYSNSMLLIKTCEMDFSKPPMKSKIVISAGEVPIGSYDNLLCITGSEGTGKSNFVSSLVSGTFLTKALATPIDTLGLTVAPNYNGYAVLHFDTEQSEYQMYRNLCMSVKRARQTDTPEYYHSFFLTPLSRKDRVQLIYDAMDYFHHKHGGIHLVVIDGVADLVMSANNEAECVAVVEDLYRLAGIYHTCIICVLHFVPNGLKLRGHIGSELQRKAASIISIEKDNDERASIIKTLKVRDGNPLDVPMYMFAWSKQEDMFVSAGQKSEEDRKSRKAADLKVLANSLLSKQALTYSDLTKAIMAQMEVALRTAKEYISSMLKLDLIEKVGEKYTLKSPRLL